MAAWGDGVTDSKAAQGGRDPLQQALAALCFASLLLTAIPLLHRDLNLDYPFMDGDSYDWIANGLFLAGRDVRYSGRAPLLPLAIALLDRLGALPVLPLLLQVLFHGTVLAFYGLATSILPRRAAFAAALALLLDHSLRGMSLQVMADVPASCLLLLAIRAFARAEDRPRSYVGAGLLAGLAALAQPVTALWVLASLVTVLALRRRHTREPRFWAGLLLFAILQAAWLASKAIVFGANSDHLARQAGLVHPHASAVLFYLWAWVALLGLPAGLLAAAGLVPAVRRAGASAPRFFSLVLLAFLLTFFVFFYDFHAKRFLVYAVWPAGLLLAEALALLRQRAAFGVVAGLAVLTAALPLPVSPNDPTWGALWPLPPVLARASVGSTPAGSAVLMPGPVARRIEPVRELIRSSSLYQAWQARPWHAARPHRIGPDDVRADRSALFLYRRPSDGGGSYRTITRLGNALHKRVKYVPAEWLGPWWTALEIREVGPIEPDYAIYRVRLPGLAETWLLATPGEGRLRRKLDFLAERPPSPASPRWIAGLHKAEAMRRSIEGSDGYVAILPSRQGADPSHLFLPFLLETTEVRLIQPADEKAALDMAATAPQLGDQAFGTTRVRKLRLLGRDSALVLYDPAAER